MSKLQRKERLKRGDPGRLVSHPLSVEVFGDDPGSQLRESVRDKGILEPLVVAADEITVVSGWRRRTAAVAEGVKRIDIRVREDLIDPLDIEEAVLDFNVRAPSTREMVARSLAARQRIKLRRKQEAAGEGVKVKATEVMQEVAADMGQSMATTRRAIDVINKEAELRESGKTKQADDLIKTLNDEGFTQAKARADEYVPPTPRPSYQDKPKSSAASPKAPEAKGSRVAAPAAPARKGLTAVEKKRLDKARQHLNSLSSSLPRSVFDDAETYIDLLRKVFDKYDR